MSKRFTLSGFWLSGPTYKVGLMLSLCGEDFAYHSVNLRAGEHKSPAFLAKNRFGQVPALEDAKSGMALLPVGGDPRISRGRARQVRRRGRLRRRPGARMDVLGLRPPRGPDLSPAGPARGLPHFPSPIVEMYFAEAGAALKVLEEALGKTAWLCGSQPSIADIDVYGVVAYAPQAGFDLAAYPAISAWTKRMEALPGFIGINDLPKATQA